MPRDILAKNFGVAESAFANIPKDVEHERYIFAAQPPGPMSADIIQPGAGLVPQTYSHRMMAQEPIQTGGGWVRITDSTNFPAASTIAAALVNVEPGAMREIHWHASDEWQYYISGRGRMTVFASGGKARTFNYQAGDVGYIPAEMAHYVQNLGDEPLRFLELFRSPRFVDFSLNQWMALTPARLVEAHLNLDAATIRASRKDKPIIVK
jgi:oxalate decarboxylase